MANHITTCVLKAANNLQICRCTKVRPLIRCLATPAGQSTVAENIRKKQAIYGTEDGTPVYLKGGPLDNILYRFTMGCCVVSLMLIGYNLIGMALPKKK